MSTSSETPQPSWEELEAEFHREVGNPNVAKPPSKTRRRIRGLIEWVAVVVGALLVAWLVQAFLFQAFVIPTGSMEPTLVAGDRVLVNKLSYRTGDISRGDVIVFHRPPEIEMAGVDDLIKRAIAIGGDTVEAQGGQVLVNGVAITERYLPPGATTEDFSPITVPEDHVFVMGDNRGPAMSFDSRFFGPIPVELVVGRAFALVWPLSNFSTL